MESWPCWMHSITPCVMSLSSLANLSVMAHLGAGARQGSGSRYPGMKSLLGITSWVILGSSLTSLCPPINGEILPEILPKRLHVPLQNSYLGSKYRIASLFVWCFLKNLCYPIHVTVSVWPRFRRDAGHCGSMAPLEGPVLSQSSLPGLDYWLPQLPSPVPKENPLTGKLSSFCNFPRQGN